MDSTLLRLHLIVFWVHYLPESSRQDSRRPKEGGKGQCIFCQSLISFLGLLEILLSRLSPLPSPSLIAVTDKRGRPEKREVAEEAFLTVTGQKKRPGKFLGSFTVGLCSERG